MSYKHIFPTLAVAAFVALALPKTLHAQYLEAGFLMGASNYTGDLSPKIELAEYHAAYGMTLRYNFSKKLSARANFLTGYLSASDANSNNPAIRARNLSFRSDITEFSVQSEFSPLGYDILDGKVSTPYVFVGLAGIYYNPQAQLNGIWYDLQPLGTEGQGSQPGVKKYSRFSVAVPMGIGFRFALGKRVNLGFEVGTRLTFTDYLDDVSREYPNVEALYEKNPVAARLSYRVPELTGGDFDNPADVKRGNPSNKDRYFVGGITLSFNLSDKYGLEWEKKYRIHDKK